MNNVIEEKIFQLQAVTYNYRIFRPIRRTVIFCLGILEKNNDDCILILVIYWKKTGLLHTKISNHNILFTWSVWKVPAN